MAKPRPNRSNFNYMFSILLNYNLNAKTKEEMVKGDEDETISCFHNGWLTG